MLEKCRARRFEGLPASERPREGTGVKREELIETGEEEDADDEVEGQRGGAGDPFQAAMGSVAEGGDGGQALQ